MRSRAWWRGLGKTKGSLGLSVLPQSEHTRCFVGRSPPGNAFEKEQIGNLTAPAVGPAS